MPGIRHSGSSHQRYPSSLPTVPPDGGGAGYSDGMIDAELTDTVIVTHALDYGQFLLGGDLFVSDAPALLAEAQEHPPSASDGRSIMVMSPHQNNFEMRVVVETWTRQPPRDDESWEQVSVERLSIGAEQVLLIESPTLEPADVSLPAGEYWVEISGRGFVNYGWPGSTAPGDDWRLRIWPASEPAADVRKIWPGPEAG